MAFFLHFFFARYPGFSFRIGLKGCFFISFIFLIPCILPAQNLFSLRSITRIELFFEESEWKEVLLRMKTEDLDQRLTAKVIINGQTFENCGVRFRGNSSFHPFNPKNPLNIKLDYRQSQNYEGATTLKLNNGVKDPSFVREVLAYEILRKYTPAPRANYAAVYVNGNLYGLFVNVEPAHKVNAGIKGEPEADSRIIVKCGPETTPDPGRGAASKSANLSWLGSDESAYQSAYSLKRGSDWEKLIEVCQVLQHNPSELDRYLDVEAAIWMLAFNNVIVNLDSYNGPVSQNYYLVEGADGRLYPIVWDLNEAFGGFRYNVPGAANSLLSVTQMIRLDPFLHQDDSGWPLIKAILGNPLWRKRYLSACKQILEENFANGWYLEEAERLQNLIAPILEKDPHAIYSMEDFWMNLQQAVGGKGQPGPAGLFKVGIASLMEARKVFLKQRLAFYRTH